MSAGFLPKLSVGRAPLHLPVLLVSQAAAIPDLTVVSSANRTLLKHTHKLQTQRT